MKFCKPYVEVPGDNSYTIKDRNDTMEIRPYIMARGGDCLGISRELAVWRFGFMPKSEAAQAYGVQIENPNAGFLWVLATRKTGKVKETFRGFALELPDNFRRVIHYAD